MRLHAQIDGLPVGPTLPHFHALGTQVGRDAEVKQVCEAACLQLPALESVTPALAACMQS